MKPQNRIKVRATVPEEEANELKRIKTLLLEKYKLEKVICFGSNQVHYKSCFSPTENTGLDITVLNSYFLLIVPASGESRTLIDLQNCIEEDLTLLINPVVIVHGMEEINTALQKGSSFFSAIYKKGILVHDLGLEPFVVPGEGIPINDRVIKREAYWNHWNGLSRDFLKGARFYAENQINHLALFMLHQTLQHCYAATLRVLIGYRTSAHSLRRLLGLVETALPDPALNFASRHSPEEKRLTTLLLKSYSDARYEQGFEVTAAEVQTLVERVEGILNAADNTCTKWIADIKGGFKPDNNEL